MASLDRARLVADRSRRGGAWCDHYTNAVDQWIGALFEAANPPSSRVALVAVGGYGRHELCPSSDIDLMLVHDRRLTVDDLADRVWYPIWDEGLKLGHSVCTVRQALSIADDDLDTATALLSARLVAGDPQLVEELAERARAGWQNRSARWLDALGRRVEDRQRQAGEVEFLLEPDLKEGRGGMRDVHALHWAQQAESILFIEDEPALEAAYRTLLDARVELQRHTGRSGNVLTRDDQPVVASRLASESPEALLRGISSAARSITWISDDTWRRVRATLSRGGSAKPGSGRAVAEGIVERNGEITVDATALLTDSALVLRLAVIAAERGIPISRDTLVRLRDVLPALPQPWPAPARELFTTLLLRGRRAVAVIESLDHHGLWERLVPEWPDVRAQPQNDPYHTFTVDRHLLETVAYAAELAPTVTRPDLLVLAALSHDLGKGRRRDHTDLSVELVQTIGARMGLAADDIEILAALVRHQLLLSDVAGRRNLDDQSTIDLVVRKVGSLERLGLLAALTEADARATGPTAWGAWKAELVAALAERVSARLLGEPAPPVAPSLWSEGANESHGCTDRPEIVAQDGIVSVMTDDHPGVFSRIAGVLALRGLDVLEAIAYSPSDGRAHSRFRVADRLRDQTPWSDVVGDLERALDGRLALEARLADRARTHARHRKFTATTPATVRFDNAASNDATVIDVEAPDAVGLLYRVTRALCDLDLDIHSAKVQTLGAHVVDAFYVRDRRGRKILDAGTLTEIERALLHAVTEAVAASVA